MQCVCSTIDLTAPEEAEAECIIALIVSLFGGDDTTFVAQGKRLKCRYRKNKRNKKRLTIHHSSTIASLMH